MTTSLTRPDSTPLNHPAPARGSFLRPTLVASACLACWPPRLRGATPGVVHAVEVHRAPEEFVGEPELAVCGAVVIAGGEAFEPSAQACRSCVAATS